MKKNWKEFSLYAVTDHTLGERELFAASEKALRGGVDILQYREKSTARSIMLRRAKKLKELSDGYGATFIVNDFIDIAYEVDADGVHLGQEDTDTGQARKVLGSNKIIGKSTHSLKEAIKAQESGVDYIAIGPIFSTPTKPGRKAVGLQTASKVSSIAKIPLVAIGGINEENLNDVISCGVRRVAVVREIFRAKDPEGTSKRLKNMVELFACP